MKRVISLLLAVLCCAWMLPAYAQNEAFIYTVDWDAEYDVVVIGYGGSGANAAISASEKGAKVLLLEKAPQGHEGGNTRYAGQIALNPTDRETAIQYLKGLRGNFGSLSDADIEAFVDGNMGNYDWFVSLGADEEKIGWGVYTEFPEVAGGESMKYFSLNGAMWQGDMWNFLAQNVKAREEKNIDVWYESPAVGLIQDPMTKTILGVKVKNGEQTYNVRAVNGVVMACGGFENSDEMLENYAQLGEAYSKGARYNTGDGINMAIEVGAKLWHMSNLAGPDVNFINPETGIAAGYMFTREKSAPAYHAFTTGSVIIVGGDGTRFMQETFTTRHGHVNVGGTYFSLQIPNNSWCVFDEKARLNMTAYPSWSEGMVDEIEKGWIIKADTVEALAAMMNIDAASLSAQIERYNGYCEKGYDDEFQVPAEYLIPIEDKGPYYAFPVKATLTNTMGGAKRDAQCRVLNTHEEPIGHLYSCGEFGSFFVDLYNGSGNIGEAVYTGRIAGANAAEPKADAVTESLLKKAAIDLSAAKEAAVVSTDTERYGTGTGIGGDVVVKVTMDADKIVGVEVISHHETAGISDKALVEIPAAIVTAQGTQVDTITGATVTSRAIIDAVNAAMAK